MLKTTFALILFWLPSVHAGDKPTAQFAELQKHCDTSWTKYRADIESLKTNSRAWLDSLKIEDVRDLYDADDQLILFISATFPDIFGGKYDGWESFKSCSDLNWRLLGAMPDRSVDHATAVTELSNCLKSRYSNGTKLLPPFDRTLACYTRQSARFKN